MEACKSVQSLAVEYLGRISAFGCYISAGAAFEKQCWHIDITEILRDRRH